MDTIAARGTVREIDASVVRAWLERGEAALHDVREPDERARERIPGSLPAPLSMFDAAAFASTRATRTVMHCKSGVRSMDAAARVAAATGGEVFTLKGGIDAWKAAGLPVDGPPAGVRVPISVLRQVQLVVGSVVLAASVLAVVFSPWWAAVAGMMGAGLLVAGATGTCGMAALLARMPWNRVFRAPRAPASAGGAPGRSG